MLRARLKGKCLLGVLCILAGILVLICCVPSWLVAIIAAFLLFSLGAGLIGLT